MEEDIYFYNVVSQ